MIVGRASELATLRRLGRSAGAGAGGSAVVEGIAGVGKTELLRALVSELPELRAVWGRVPEEGGAPAFWPWREITSTAGWDVSWEGDADVWSRGARIADAVRSAAAEHPLLLLVDDLHAADDDTVRMTSYLAAVLHDAPVVLVVASRPDERLGGLSQISTTLSLEPLTDEDSGRVIDLHAAGQVSEDARREILRVAEGSPLVLRELSRAAGTGRLTHGLRSSVQQRLAPLPVDARDLVERAAVLGRAFDVRTLAELSGRAPDDVVGLLDGARRLGVLDGEGPRWSFSHQIVRDVVYRSLSEDHRLALHRDAAAALRASAGGRGPGLVAEHLLRAVPVVPAVEAVEAARAAAAETAAAGERAELLTRALPLVEEESLRLRVLLDLGDARLASGAVHAGAEAFADAVALAGRLGDQPARARALLGRCAIVETSAAALEHVPALIDAAATARSTGDEPSLVRLLARIATLRATDGDGRAAIPHAQEALDVARGLPADPVLLATALGALHVCCWAPGLEAESARTSAELVEVATASGDLDLALEAEVARMVDALRTGDLALLDEALARAGGLAERSGSPRHHFFVLSRRGMRAIVAGRLAEAAALLAKAYAVGSSIEEPDALQVLWGAQFLVLAELNSREELLSFADALAEMSASEPKLAVVEANLRAAAGQPEEARRLLAFSLDDLEPAEAGHGLDLAWLALMANVAVSVGDRELAARVERSVTAFRGTMIVNAGAVTFCGITDHWLGLLAGTQGRTDEARTLLSGALDVYEAMGATWFVRRVREELADLDGRQEPASLAARGAVLRRTADGWEAGWAGHEGRFPEARGLHHLHTLLGTPHTEVHAADLMRPGASAMVGGGARDALLDDTAKRAYRERITALQSVVSEAEELGDVDRAQGAASGAGCAAARATSGRRPVRAGPTTGRRCRAGQGGGAQGAQRHPHPVGRARRDLRRPPAHLRADRVVVQLRAGSRGVGAMDVALTSTSS